MIVHFFYNIKYRGVNCMNTINNNNIKVLRKKKDIYQMKLAMDLDLTQETVSAYERNKVKPSVDVLIKMADYFDTSIDYIVGRTEYDLPIKNIKPNNINDEDFILLNKIKKLSPSNKLKAEGYIDGLNDK